MTISAIVPVPSAVSELESYFSALQASATSAQASAMDPFSVLLDAATQPNALTSSTVANSSSGSSAYLGGSSEVSPQLVGLASPGTPASVSTAIAAGASQSGLAIVQQATAELGVPYVWGGSTPATGFDCSGLVQYVFAQLGTSLPRTAAQQEQVGTPIASLSQAQPGDLLFFEPGQNGAPPGEAGHVAIYIGNNQMIAAPQTGQDVQVQPVPSTPLAIRRISVATPSTSSVSTSSLSSVSTSSFPASPSGALSQPSSASFASTSGSGSAASSGAGVTTMGNVQVPNQYVGLIDSAASSSGTPANLLAALLYNESRFEPNAVSSAGAEGIAQIMPTTAAANGISPFDPSSAIRGAASLLSQYHAAFGTWSDALAAYAAGGTAVVNAGGIPQDGTTPGYVATTLALAGMASGS